MQQYAQFTFIYILFDSLIYNYLFVIAVNVRAELNQLFHFTPVGSSRKRKTPAGMKRPNTWTHTLYV